VLPYGIRQLIKDFLGALDNVSIGTAVKLWCENRKEAIARYGHISLWDTSRVTDMSKLFYGQHRFNDDISGWVLSKATTMREMFRFAYTFNQPIGTWNTSNVTDMSLLFNFAASSNQPLQDWDVSSVTNMGTSRYQSGMSPLLRICGICSPVPHRSISPSTTGMYLEC
jgi:surface protein